MRINVDEVFTSIVREIKRYDRVSYKRFLADISDLTDCVRSHRVTSTGVQDNR
jgi:hypothetical protein